MGFVGDTLGAPRAQTCARGVTPLDPRLAKQLVRNYRTSAACGAGVYESLMASGPRKPGKSPGKSSLFPKGLFPGFPRMLCIRVGRQRRPGQKHKAVKFYLPFHSNSGNQVVSTHQVISAGEGPGESFPWWGAGQSPAGFLPLQIPIYCSGRQKDGRYTPETDELEEEIGIAVYQF